MIDILVRLLVLLAAFASVYLLSQVVLGLIWSSRARFAAVNQRLELIRRGASTEQVMAKLRKNAPMEFAGLPPTIGRQLTKLQRMLFASALNYTLPQVLRGLVLLTSVLLALFILALVPQFVDPARGPVLGQFMLFGLILSVGGTVINGLVGGFAGRIGQGLARKSHLTRALQYATSFVFLGLAAKLGLDRR